MVTLAGPADVQSAARGGSVPADAPEVAARAIPGSVPALAAIRATTTIRRLARMGGLLEDQAAA
jgi:hypothetical protein